jgi:hypothetical protein
MHLWGGASSGLANGSGAAQAARCLDAKGSMEAVLRKPPGVWPARLHCIRTSNQLALSGLWFLTYSQIGPLQASVLSSPFFTITFQLEFFHHGY